MKSIATNEKDQIARIMAGLNCSEEEAREIFEDDKKIDHGESMEFDLPPDKLKDAQKFAHTGTRKAPIKFKKKVERKPNATKAGIIDCLFRFFNENEEFSTENVQILNKERQISFKIGEETYELTLVQKRKPKK